MSGFMPCSISPVPHAASVAAVIILGCGSVGPQPAHRMRVALEHDERGGARRICCREQRPRRERAGAREKDRFAAAEIVEYRSDAVGQVLDRWERARPDRSDAPVPGWSKKISRPSDVIASDPPLKRRRLRHELTIADHVGRTRCREPSRDAR